MHRKFCGWIYSKIVLNFQTSLTLVVRYTFDSYVRKSISMLQQIEFCLLFCGQQTTFDVFNVFLTTSLSFALSQFFFLAPPMLPVLCPCHILRLLLSCTKYTITNFFLLQARRAQAYSLSSDPLFMIIILVDNFD